MPRPKKSRFVAFEPDVTYFKPRGIPLRDLDEETLSVEELEALRLEFIDCLNQEDSAARMNVSRPTFSRMLNSAGKKVSVALSDGKAIRIQGGNYEFKKEAVNMPRGLGRGQGSGLGAGGAARGRNQGFGLGPGGNCVCPNCNTTATHIRGTPCYQQKCPKCGSAMTRQR